jgi:hypothetical protein
MSLKSKLLNPEKEKPIVIEMFGGKFPVAKMSTAKLSGIEKKMDSLREAGVADDINDYTASVILDSIIDEKGAAMSDSVKPLELLETYDVGAVTEALHAVYEANYAGLKGSQAAKND